MSKVGRGVRKTLYFIAGICALASAIILIYSIMAKDADLTDEDTSAPSVSVEDVDVAAKIAQVNGNDFWDKAEQYLKGLIGDKAGEVIDDIIGSGGLKTASWPDIEWEENAEAYREFKKIVDYLNEQARKSASGNSASGNSASGNNR